MAGRNSGVIVDIELLKSRLEEMRQRAIHGDREAELRFQAAIRLLNPTLEFTEEDLRPVLESVKRPISQEK